MVVERCGDADQEQDEHGGQVVEVEGEVARTGCPARARVTRHH